MNKKLQMVDFIKKNYKDLFFITFFFVLPFIFFNGAFEINSVIFGYGDAVEITLPMHQLYGELIRNLEAPFWNNYNFSGYPLLSYIESNVFYLPNFILNLFFPINIAYNIGIFFHYSLSGVFMYLFMKEYGLNKLASFASGLIFMFSGSMISGRSHPWSLYTMIWIPLVLLFLEKYRKIKKIRYILMGSIFYSLSFFGGRPQIFLYGSMVILLFIIYYSFIFDGIKNFYFLSSLLIFIVGFFMISIQSFPTYELLQLSLRKEIDYNYFSSFSFEPLLLPALVFPFIFGIPTETLPGIPAYFGPWNYTEMIRYFGISTIILFIFGIFVKNKHKYFWIFILVFSFILVLGDNTPIYKLMYKIPIYNKFRVPARNWFEFSLAFSILCGFGFDYYINLDKKKIKKISLAIIIFSLVLLVSFLVFYILFKFYVLKGI